MKPLRLVVAGAGLIGRRHIELIGQSSECELAGIVDVSPPASAYARQLGVRLFASLPEACDALKPDGVIVATPNARHVPDGLACVERGIAVLVEKPVAETVHGARKLVEVAERHGVPLLVGHHRRHSPALAAAHRIIQSGVLGRLVAVQGAALFYKPESYFEAGPWRREAGGGPILINMVHEVDNLRYLCGDIVEVQAAASHAARGFAVEDTVAISLRFAGGALGSFMLSDAAAAARSWELTSGENPDYPRQADEDCYLIAGTRGSLAVPNLRLRYYAGEASWWKPFAEETPPVEAGDPLALQLAHFCAVIRGKASPLVSGREGLETLRATLAIAQAAKSGRAVAPADLETA